MVNWTSQEELLKDKAGYVNIVFAFFGLYVWEIFQTSDFEWAVITRRRKIRWHWVFLFLCRYCLILSIVALMASFTVMKPINCQSLYTFISWAGNMSLMCASTTLALRTVAVWERKLAIAIPLGVLCLALWALLWRGMFILSAQYDPASMGCVVMTTKRLFLSVTFWATMSYNLVLTVVHVVGLMQRDYSATLWRMLFDDGLLCYIVAFASNAIPAILSVLNLNPVMNVIATVPAAVLTAMAACRTVTRLSEVGEEDDLYVHSASQLTTPRVPPPATFRVHTTKNSRFPPRPEVHVTTDHIVMEDFASSPETPYTPYTPHDKPPELAGDHDHSDSTDRTYNAV